MKYRSQGFTLVEMILTIVIVGIVSVYAVPKLLDRSDLAANIYQDRAISILRNMQTRAMQDTRNDGYCYKVNFDAANEEFGVPTLNFEQTTDTVQIAATCANTIDTSDASEFYYVPSSALVDDNIDLEASANDGTDISSIEFDSLGRANQNGLECDPVDSNTEYSGCRIEFNGGSSVYVCVESEGYIYAC